MLSTEECQFKYYRISYQAYGDQKEAAQQFSSAERKRTVNCKFYIFHKWREITALPLKRKTERIAPDLVLKSD